jgi:hypothetical protein
MTLANNLIAVNQPPKFGRTYQLTIQPDAAAAAIAGNVNAEPIVVSLPYTIEFDITRNILSKANVCQIRIYNLGLLKRNQLRLDRTNYGNKAFRGVILKAGYGLNPSVIFAGNITQASSKRETGGNFITTIECYVGGSAYINARTDRTYISGTPYQTIIQDMVTSLNAYGIGVGAVGLWPGTVLRDTTFSGNTVELLRRLTGGGFFIDQAKANCLNNNEYIQNLNTITTISSDSGLLGTPQLEANIISFDMIFEPRLDAGQYVNLVSSTANNFNGYYKCISVKHRGMISAAVCGSVITTVGLQNIKNPVGVPSQNPSNPVIQ